MNPKDSEKKQKKESIWDDQPTPIATYGKYPKKNQTQ